MPLSVSAFGEIIALGREQRGVEFKGPGRRSDKEFFAKVARAIIAMANRRDGGRVIIGVEETDRSLNPVGLDAQLLETWNFDDVGDLLARYVDPPVTFNVEVVDFERRSFVVITVSEFEEIPILCKRDYPGVLRDGACYVRSRRKPESVEVPSHAEMRELLDLATEKQLRRFLARASAVGLTGAPAQAPTVSSMFEAELPEELR